MNVLAIGAHPDDIEIACAGTLAKCVKRGDTVIVCHASSGDLGTDYDGLICHVTHAKPQGQGIDECAAYGDFFYLEALARYLVPGFKKYW